MKTRCNPLASPEEDTGSKKRFGMEDRTDAQHSKCVVMRTLSEEEDGGFVTAGVLWPSRSAVSNYCGCISSLT